MKTQIAFRNRDNQVLIARFDSNKVIFSDGQTITESANAHRRRTNRGNNLKVNPITTKNWQRAATVFCDKIGFFRRVDTLEAEQMDFDNPPQPANVDKTPFAWIENLSKDAKWLSSETETDEGGSVSPLFKNPDGSPYVSHYAEWDLAGWDW